MPGEQEDAQVGEHLRIAQFPGRSRTFEWTIMLSTSFGRSSGGALRRSWIMESSLPASSMPSAIWLASNSSQVRSVSSKPWSRP